MKVIGWENQLPLFIPAILLARSDAIARPGQVEAKLLFLCSESVNFVYDLIAIPKGVHR
jgi:hypothetical protein